MSTTGAPNPFATATSAAGASPTAAPASPFTNGSANVADASAIAGAGAVPDQPVQYEEIDLNSPLLTSEKLVNTEGDAYAQPAPPPDGKYRVKLKLEGIKHDAANPNLKKLWPDKVTGDIVPYEIKTHQNKSGQVDQIYLSTAISASIIDTTNGKYDGLSLYDSWVSTFQGRDASTKIQTILKLLKQPNGHAYVEAKPGSDPNAMFRAGVQYKQQQWMDAFVKALAGEPEIGVETVWEWSCQTCGENAKRSGGRYPKSVKGMQNFPMSRTQRGEYNCEMPCQQAGHGTSRARATIARFVAL